MSDYLFRVRGVAPAKVEVLRYQTDLVHRVTGREISSKFPTEAQAQRQIDLVAADGQGTITALDVSDCEWMDGLEVANFDEAVDIYEMGQEAWEAKQSETQAMTPEQLRADVVFIATIMGVDLT